MQPVDDILRLSELGAPIMVCDPSGAILAATPSAQDLLDRVGADSHTPSSLWLEIRSAPSAESVQWRAPGGLTLGCTAYPMAGERVLVLMREITARNRELSMQLHRQRLELTGQIAASVAHEIRTSLLSIFFNVDFLRGKIPTEQDSALACLEEIDTSCKRVRETVDSLLHFARLEPAESHSVNLRDVLSGVSLMVQPTLRSTGSEMRYELDEGADWVRGNSLAVEQIISNLVLNAIEGDGTGARRQVEISARLATDLPGSIVIQVADDGPGVPPEIRDHLFEPFFTTREGGTGLGLWIAQEAAQNFGGDLKLVSSEGGAIFELTLPKCVRHSVEPRRRT